MGKAVITKNLGGGLYEIIPQYDLGDIDNQIDSLIKIISILDKDINEIENNDDIYNSNILNSLKLKRLSFQTHLNRLITVKSEALMPKQAWCIDYSDNLTGTVATLEIPGTDEHVQITKVVIRNQVVSNMISFFPEKDEISHEFAYDYDNYFNWGTQFHLLIGGYTSYNGYPEPVHNSFMLKLLSVDKRLNLLDYYYDYPLSVLKPVLSLNDYECFFLYALLPGWQKHKPTYRYGKITNIYKDTCDVVLEKALTNDLNINQYEILYNVPIEYKTDVFVTKFFYYIFSINSTDISVCTQHVYRADYDFTTVLSNSSIPFKTDDEIILKFSEQNWEKPSIIGFKKAPPSDFQGRVFRCGEIKISLDTYPPWYNYRSNQIIDRRELLEENIWDLHTFETVFKETLSYRINGKDYQSIILYIVYISKKLKEHNDFMIASGYQERRKVQHSLVNYPVLDDMAHLYRRFNGILIGRSRYFYQDFVNEAYCLDGTIHLWHPEDCIGMPVHTKLSMATLWCKNGVTGMIEKLPTSDGYDYGLQSNAYIWLSHVCPDDADRKLEILKNELYEKMTTIPTEGAWNTYNMNAGYMRFPYAIWCSGNNITADVTPSIPVIFENWRLSTH